MYIAKIIMLKGISKNSIHTIFLIGAKLTKKQLQQSIHHQENKSSVSKIILILIHKIKCNGK